MNSSAKQNLPLALHFGHKSKPLSIIIPTLNEAESISTVLQRLAGDCSRQRAEIIVVDGNSNDATASIAAEFADSVIVSRRGRAHQMNAGVQIAHGTYLCFLHADTVLSNDAIDQIQNALQYQGAHWGFFEVRLDSSLLVFRLIETAINLRSRCTAVATGDQAIFMTREMFERVGGFPPVSLMEDIAMSKQLCRFHRPACLRAMATTSVRRWQKHGVIKTVLLMWWLRLAYVCGISPQRLAQWYRNH